MEVQQLEELQADLSVQVFGISDVWRYIDIGAAQIGRGVDKGGEVASAQHRDLGLGNGHSTTQEFLAGDRTAAPPW
jgi:hypothetical protein